MHVRSLADRQQASGWDLVHNDGRQRFVKCDSGPLVRRSAIPKVHYSEAYVPQLVYKLAEACYISVTGTNPNPKP